MLPDIGLDDTQDGTWQTVMADMKAASVFQIHQASEQGMHTWKRRQQLLPASLDRYTRAVW